MEESQIQALRISFNSNAKQAAREINTLANALRNVGSIPTEKIGGRLSNALNRIGKAINAINTQKLANLAVVANSMTSANTAIRQTANAVSDLTSSMSEGGQTEGGATAIGAIVDKAEESKSEIKGLGKEMDKGGDKAETLGQKVQKNVGRIVVYRLIREAISKIVNAMKEGYEAVNAWASTNDTKLYNSINNVSAAINNMKYALGGVLANVVEVFEPIITWLGQGVVEIANYVSWLVAAVGGMSTYTAYTYDATKATNNLKRAMLGLDEINTLGDGTANGGFSYMTKAVEDLSGLGTNSTLRTFFGDVKEAGEWIAKAVDKFMNSSIISSVKGIIDKVINIAHQLQPVAERVFNLVVDSVMPILEAAIDILDKLLGSGDWASVIGCLIETISALTAAINIATGAVLYAAGYVSSRLGDKTLGESLMAIGQGLLTSGTNYYSDLFTDLTGSDDGGKPTLPSYYVPDPDPITLETPPNYTRYGYMSKQITTGYLAGSFSKSNLRNLQVY